MVNRRLSPSLLSALRDQKKGQKRGHHEPLFLFRRDLHAHFPHLSLIFPISSPPPTPRRAGPLAQMKSNFSNGPTFDMWLHFISSVNILLISDSVFSFGLSWIWTVSPFLLLQRNLFKVIRRILLSNLFMNIVQH